MYLTTEDDLLQARATAFAHCRPGGVALFVPDCVRETFAPRTECGGHDGDGQALRYLEWTWDPDPSDSTFLADYAYILHEADHPPRREYEQHTCGLFARADWLCLLTEVGFQAKTEQIELSDESFPVIDVFVGTKPTQ